MHGVVASTTGAPWMEEGDGIEENQIYVVKDHRSPAFFPA